MLVIYTILTRKETKMLHKILVYKQVLDKFGGSVALATTCGVVKEPKNKIFL